MKKTLLSVAVATLISGCGMFGTKPTPPIQYVPQEVKVEVPVKCTPAQIDKPDTSFDRAQKTDTLFSNLALLGAENESLAAYTIKLEAALKGCTK